MRKTTLKTAVLLLGKMDHLDLIKKMDMGTQNDITQKGMSLVMPMILGAIAGFMFSKETFGFGPLISGVIGLVLALMVMIVDRTFLNKIGEGHGESRLYLGGKNSKELIDSIFNTKDPTNQVLIFSKKNIMRAVKFFELFF